MWQLFLYFQTYLYQDLMQNIVHLLWGKMKSTDHMYFRFFGILVPLYLVKHLLNWKKRMPQQIYPKNQKNIYFRLNLHGGSVLTLPFLANCTDFFPSRALLRHILNYHLLLVCLYYSLKSDELHTN